MKVYQAINKVQSALAQQGISKAHRNNQGAGYNFRGIDDVYNAISPLLAENGLCILPRILSRSCEERQSKAGGALFYVTVEAEFDLVCAEDGSKHTIKTFGEAMDSGDKGTNKAMSAAYKYAAFQAFAIPTQGDNDADGQTHEVASRQASPMDMSPKARAHRIAAGVEQGDAVNAAAAMAGWDDKLRDTVWNLLPPKVQDKLTKPGRKSLHDMPYRDPRDRLAAKRRYNASPKGKATRRRYYLETRPEPKPTINPAPLAQVLKEWK